MDVSIAYQGGGAKLFDLLAAVEACRQLATNERQFRLYRVSGASAGAVAAAIHALDGDIEAILAKAAEFDRLLGTKFPAKRMRLLTALRRLMFSQSVFDSDAVHATLLKLFEVAGIDANLTITQLMRGRRVQLRIVSSDILGLSVPVHTETSPVPLIDTLVDSCAIPFAFRMPVAGSAKGNILDGGLFQNLPAREALKALPAGARALGVSFKAPQRQSVEGLNFLRYGAAVVDSMISERVEDAASQLGPANVIQLTTETGTFDFYDLFKGEVRARFTDKKARARSLLKEWFDRSLRRTTPNWFSTEAHDLLELEHLTSEKITDFFAALGQESFHADEARHEIFAQSLLGDEHPDVYATTLKLSGAKNVGLQFFRFRFYSPHGRQLLEPSVRVEQASGSPALAKVLPLRERGGSNVRSALICLAKPLTAGDSITLVKTERACGAMRGYLEDGLTEEYLGLGPGRSADVLAVSAHFPRGTEPKLWRDADATVDVERAKLGEKSGIHLKSTSTRTEDAVHDLVTLTNSTQAASVATTTNRFLMVFYYK